MTQNLTPLGYFGLLDACGLPGCPLCRLEARVTRSYPEAILYENVNGPGAQAELQRSRGYGHDHAWQLTQLSGGAALGVAILHGQVIGRALERAPDEIALVALQSLSQAKLLQLKHELDEFIRKNDYRFQAEGSDAEADRWPRALAWPTGTE